MNRTFKIHCSQIGKIMGRMGLTDKQEAKLNELNERKLKGAKPLTKNMEDELAILIDAKKNPPLPETCTSYLKTWYAGDKEQIDSKYTRKGNEVENDLITFMSWQLGYADAEKNTITAYDEYLVGTCDVNLPGVIIDVKAPWNKRTLQENCCSMDTDYEWQLRGYMRLYNRREAILFYGLMDTPAFTDWDEEVIYSDMPDLERWIAFKITRDLEIEQAIIDRVLMCREWLEDYDQTITSRMGRVHIL